MNKRGFGLRLAGEKKACIVKYNRFAEMRADLRK